MKSITIDGRTYRFFNHLYAVSRNGNIIRNLEPYEPITRSDGYVAIGRQSLLHRMVATCWIEKPEGANHVHHKNHNKQDNCASNLEWVTPKSHMNDYHSGQTHTMSNAGKMKLRALRLGSKTSDETKQKQRIASIANGAKPPPRPIGAKCDLASIQKMRDNSPNAMQCEIFGIIYKSFSEAGRALGEKPHSLRKRCLSNNFPDYKARK